MNRRTEQLIALQNLDVMIREVRAGHEERLGFRIENLDDLLATRETLAGQIDPHDLAVYERLAKRYDHVSAVVPVRDKNCLGCFMDLPTSAVRRGEPDQGLMICENCGRVLYWV